MGGIAARRTSAVPIVLISQAAGLLLVVALLPVFPHASPTTADLAWGAAAGVAGGTGVALLYHALAIGTMSVVAPTTAVCAVAIPVLASFALGERPGLLHLVSGASMAAGIFLLVRERHGHMHSHEEMEHDHAHVHDDHHGHDHDGSEPPGEPHAHLHRHAPLVHDHPHVPELHHRHRH